MLGAYYFGQFAYGESGYDPDLFRWHTTDAFLRGVFDPSMPMGTIRFLIPKPFIQDEKIALTVKKRFN